MALLQWNCNGFNIHKAEVTSLVSNFNPICVSIQETHFKITDLPVIRGYTFYKFDDVSGNRARGGVACAVHDSYHSIHVPLRTPFQAIAVRIALPTPMTICNIYLPEWILVTRTRLEMTWLIITAGAVSLKPFLTTMI